MIYLATDWHLWKYNKKLKQCVKNPHFDSILRNAQVTLADDDVLLYLGDFTDDEMKNEKKLVGVLNKIPGYKILVRGNNDTMSDSAYLAAGFDRVVEIAILGNIIFTHHPVYVGPGQLNVHGHNHGKFNLFATRLNIDIYTKDGELIPLDEVLRHKQPDFRIPIRGKFWREAHPKHYVTHGRIFDLEEYYRNGVDGIPVDESVFRKDAELEIGDFLDSIEEQASPQEEKEAYLNKIKYLAESYFTGESIRPMNEMLEFKVGSHPKPDHGMVMLFHGTPENVNRIEPVSRNVGTRFSKPRTSSFWASRYEVAQVMGIWRLLANKMWPLSSEEKVSFYIDFRKNKYVIPKSDVAKLDKLLKGETLYIYLATVPEKYVGKGHDPDVDEYSVDLTVVPHNRVAIKNLNHKFVAFEILPDAEYQRNVAFYGNVKGRKLPIRDRLIYHSNFRKNAAALNDRFKDAREYGLQSFRGAVSESVDDIIDEVLFQNFEDAKDFEEDDDVARRHQDPEYQPTYRVRFRKRQKQSKDELPNDAESIDESIIFNRANQTFNLEDWKPGKHNVLFVVGMSGSGKSTFAENLEKKNLGVMLELDGLEQGYDSTQIGVLDELAKQCKSFGDYWSKIREAKNANELKAIQNREFRGNFWGEWGPKLLQLLHTKYSDKKFIVEGIQPFNSSWECDASGEPVIIIGTSIVNSILRRFKRNAKFAGKKHIQWTKELKNEFFELVRWYFEQNKDLDKLEKSLKEDAEYDIVAESSIIDLTLPLMQPEMSEALEKMRKRMQDETNTKLSCIEEVARVKYVRLIRKGEFDNARRRAKAKREKDPLRTSGPFEGALKSVSIDEKNSMIIIKGINFQKLMARIKNMYDTKKVNNLFDPTYSKWTLYLYNTEQISKSEMKIVDVRVPLFFALELQQIFYDLSDYYQLKYYEEIGDLIYKKTWVSNVDKPVQRTEVDVDGALKKFTLEPLPYQLGYMQEYFNITRRFNFDGHILTFKPGYGKTFTAALIAEAAPDVDQVVVVCPNTLKENWASEIKSYYKKYSNEKTFSEEVFVSGNARYKFNKQKAKWIIVNQESIPMVFDKVAKKNVMIIVDECQYFRNYETKRVKDLLQLKDITNAAEVLMMSGTPIHATPDEALPALLMIDPMMTLDLAKKYKSAFSVDNTYLERVINARMGIVMYDIPSEVLKLPAKTVTSLKLPLNNDKKFLLYNVEAEISARYKKYYAELGVDADKYKVQFHEILRKYSSADKTLTKNYIDFVDAGSNYLTVHESKSTIYRTFLKTYVYPNIPDNERPQVKETMANYVYMSAKARGLAQGEVYPPLYNEVNIRLWDEHEDEFIDRIQNNLKKTLIFTPYVSVANYIEERLDSRKIGVIKITGSVVKNRMDMINAFRNSDDIEVLVATYNVAGTGLTLIEASQVFFFGVPYRSADFDQAADRVYRIGQTSDVFIYKVLLQSSVANAKNITERQDEIMEWSRSMSSAYTKGAKTQIEFDFDDIPVDESATAIQRANAYWGEDNPEPFFGKESYNNKWDDAYDDAYDDDSVTFDESLITPIDYIPDFNDSVNEASSGKLYPVYVMLMHSGTALSTAISFVTKSNFSHSSISFDASMSTMYSFGRKFDTNPFIGTFKKEDIHSNFFTQKKIPYALYVVPVTADELVRMQKRLDYFIKNSTKFKYDFVGLFKNYLGIVDNPEYKWFCSRFVADILNAGQPTSPRIKHPNLVKPKDFAKMSFAKYVTGGLLQDYDQKEVETITSKILSNEEKKRLLNVNESWEDSLPTDVDGGDAEHIDGTKKDFMTASDPLIGDVWDDYDKPITGKGMSESNLQPLSDRQAVIIPISSNGKLYYQAEDLRFFAAWLEDMYRSVIYQMKYAEVDAKSLAQIKLIIGWMMKFILHADVNVSDYNKQGAQETIDTAEKLLKLCAKRYQEIGINWSYVNSVVDPIYNEYKKKLEDLEIVDLALGKQAVVIEIP